MSSRFFVHAQESGPCMCYDVLYRLNREINSLELAIKGGEYQLCRQVIPEELCDKTTGNLWERIFNVGASRFSLRLLKNNQDLHPANFLNCRTGDGLIDHVTVWDRVVKSVLNDGGTLVFDHSNEHIVAFQIIQENIEPLLGCRCWIQCYVTKSLDSAFGMHGDDHPFLIVQLKGRKRWMHGNSSAPKPTDRCPEIIYGPGDMAFYPGGKLHDVHGMGELSIHLTVAFDSFDGRLFEDLSSKEKARKLVPRIGTSLPYSIAAESVDESTGVRLACSCLPPIVERGKSFALIQTQYNSIKLPYDFIDAIRWIKSRRKTSALDIADRFDLDLERCVNFVRFGLSNELFLVGLGA